MRTGNNGRLENGNAEAVISAHARVVESVAAAGSFLPRIQPPGKILVSIADSEKEEGVAILRRYAALGFTLVATDGTRFDGAQSKSEWQRGPSSRIR